MYQFMAYMQLLLNHELESKDCMNILEKKVLPFPTHYLYFDYGSRRLLVRGYVLHHVWVRRKTNGKQTVPPFA